MVQNLQHIILGAVAFFAFLILCTSVYEHILSRNPFDTAPVEAEHRLTGQKRIFRNTPSVPLWYAIVEQDPIKHSDVKSKPESGETMNETTEDAQISATSNQVNEDPFALPPQEKVFVDPEGRYKLTIPEGIVYKYNPPRFVRPQTHGIVYKYEGGLYLWTKESYENGIPDAKKYGVDIPRLHYSISFEKEEGGPFSLEELAYEIEMQNGVVKVYSPYATYAGHLEGKLKISDGYLDFTDHMLGYETDSDLFKKIIQGIEVTGKHEGVKLDPGPVFGETKCYENDKYFVVVANHNKETIHGGDHLVKYKESPNQFFDCKYLIEQGDFEIQNNSASYYFFRLEGNYLIIDSASWQMAREVVVYDLAHQKIVHSDMYYAPLIFENGKLKYWSANESSTEANSENCPIFAKLMEESERTGFLRATGFFFELVTFDLNELKIEHLGEKKCVEVNV